MQNGMSFDEIRKEVAMRHNVLLGKDDPILVTITLNELVLGHYVELMAERAERSQNQAIAATAHQVEAAKEAAGKLITDASSYVAGEIKRAALEAASEAADKVRRQIADAEQAGQDAHVAKRGANWAAIVAAGAAVIALAAMVVVLVR